jgi:hypothetical protein
MGIQLYSLADRRLSVPKIASSAVSRSQCAGSGLAYNTHWKPRLLTVIIS